ncbi:MAG: hypothetical protein ACPLSJ_04400 [Thermosulfidibacteraceae bacterium]|jgi:magnesium-transporting ATPase (P-type)
MVFDSFVILKEMAILSFIVFFIVVFGISYWFFDEPWFAVFLSLLSSVIPSAFLVILTFMDVFKLDLEVSKDDGEREDNSNLSTAS